MEVTQIETVSEQALEKVITDSGLQLSDAEAIKQSYLPFFNQLAGIKAEAEKINFDNPTTTDEMIARELRLRTVKIRTGSELVKDERKKIHSLKANLEQSAWNLIKSTCQLDEERFNQVEKRREILEKQRKADLKKERTEKLLLYCEIAEQLPLGEMSEVDFENMFNGYKATYDAKVEAERKAEEERLLKAEQERLENERIRVENERLRVEAEQKEKALAAERAEQERILAEQQAKLEEERKMAAAKLEQERKEAEEKLRIERESQAKQLAEAEKKAQEVAAKLKAEQDAILEQERAAKAKLEAELKAKADAELKLKQEAEQNEKDRIAAEKAAAKAPDKVKLKAWIESIKMNDIPTGLSNESGTVGMLISNKFDGFKTWALQQIELL